MLGWLGYANITILVKYYKILEYYIKFVYMFKINLQLLWATWRKSTHAPCVVTSLVDLNPFPVATAFAWPVQHLQPHLQRPAYSTHLLVEPLMDVSCCRCPAHQEVFRYYCMDDREYVCPDCILEGRHAQHQVKGVRKVEEEYKVSH